MELVVVDPKEFGLEESKVKEMSKMFAPMFEKMEDLGKQLDEVLALPMNEETYTKARELRLEYKRTRTGTATIHKELKAHSLKVGKFLDAWKNTQALTADGAEERLSAIEQYEEREKQRKIDALQEKRTKALKKYDLEVVPDNLGELDTVSWNSFLTGTRVNSENRKKKEKKDEEERLETERIVSLGNMRTGETIKYADFIPEYKTLRLGEIGDKEYHAILQKAKDDFDAKVKQDKLDKVELERLQKESEERKEKEEEERKERAAEAQANEDKLKIQLRAKEKAEKELADRKAEDERKLKEEDDKRQADLNADDATKVESLVNNLEYLTTIYTFKSAKNEKMYVDVRALIGKVINHIRK